MAEAPQAVVMVNLHSEFDDLKRAPQIHIQTALFGFPVKRGRAMNYRICSVDQTIVVITRQAKTLVGQIAAKDPDPRLQVFVKRLEIEMQLKSAPEALFGLVRITRAYQQVQRRAVIVH